ncbi:cupin domain-containing protein [Streptomyces xanthochromogenes]|uniref:cupin domain-containing protein n=1 Tax=Streptomyces xanthochromogenes TaxID=67384 RepID=UPI003816DA60
MNQQMISGFSRADIESAPLIDVSTGRIWTAHLTAVGGLAADLYAFAPGAAAGEGFHLTTELGFVIDGELKDENGAYPAGSLWVAAAGTVHHPCSESGARALVVQTSM